MKYIVLRNFLSEFECDKLIDAYFNKQTPRALNLEDGNDQANVTYKSKRSKNLHYKYLDVDDAKVGLIDERVKLALEDLLGVGFRGKTINDKCLPMFAYGKDGLIKAHRGVQKACDVTKYQAYVAVAQLTQRGIDFEGGEFYINPTADASADGKTVYNDNSPHRLYPLLNKGDVCLFYNPELVHGVETVRETSEGNAFRLTCSWRTNQEQ